MTRILFICFSFFFISITNSQAQLLKFSKKNKDEHFKFSDYKPERDRKRERQLKKEMKELQASSYSPEKSKYYKKEDKEAKYHKLRLKRSQKGKISLSDKKNKLTRKDYSKKYDKQERKRIKTVMKNKKTYGTKDSREAFRTDKSDQWILENDQENLQILRIRNPFRKR